MSKGQLAVMIATAGMIIWTQPGLANYMDDCGGAPLNAVLPNGCQYITTTDSLLSAYKPPDPLLQKDLVSSFYAGTPTAAGSGSDVIAPDSEKPTTMQPVW